MPTEKNCHQIILLKIPMKCDQTGKQIKKRKQTKLTICNNDM